MGHIEENVENVPVFRMIERKAFEDARSALTKKRRTSLVNFINACCWDRISDANMFKRIYDDCEKHIEFIDGMLETMK